MRNLHEINKVEIPDKVKWTVVWFNVQFPHLNLRWSPLEKDKIYYKSEGAQNWTEDSMEIYSAAGQDDYSSRKFDLSMVEIF